MADRRIGDIGVAIAVGVFVIGVFFYGISDMDANTVNSDNLYTHLSDVNSNLSKSGNAVFFDKSGLDDSTLGSNGSKMTLGQTQFIDTRGTGQGNILTTNSRGTLNTFLVDAVDLTKWDYNGLIAKLVMSLITIVASVLLIRLFLGGYRV